MVFKKDGKVYGSIGSVVGEHCQKSGIALVVCYIAREVRNAAKNTRMKIRRRWRTYSTLK